MNSLVISCHPDDETLGCGGTLLKEKAAGNSLFWMIVTQAHEPQWTAQVIERKAEEVQRVGEAYGMEECFNLGFPTVKLDTVPQFQLMDKMRKVIETVCPPQIYVVHRGDVHTDHQAVYTATMSVLKPFYMARLGVMRILSYETLSSTEAAAREPGRDFAPNVFNDITGHLEGKLDIMKHYQSEVHQDPMPRGPSAIRALARYRGATIGVEYAEAFELVREIR